MRAAGTSVENSFVNGLVTEFSGLNFPESAVTDCDNCVFEKTGLVRRRLGIDFEEDYVANSETVNGVLSHFRWDTVDNNGSKSFIVSQSGDSVYFYEISGLSLSDGKKSFSINLNTYRVVGADATSVRENKASFSAGNGYLFIAHRHCEPIYVEYDSDMDSITVDTVSIKIRDLEGIDDGLEVSERPSTLSKEHEYNLQNQGWANAVGVNGPRIEYGVFYWEKYPPTDGNYPSNSDIPSLFKDASDELNTFYFSRRGNDNSPAAKGHFILDAFDLNRTITSPSINSTGTVERITSNGLRPEFTEFFAGRVWWSGVRAIGFNSKVYFSKIIESDKDFGLCHQVNDPTSENLNELLPTDGGLINIPDAAEIIYMKSVNNSLLVFATNGVWAISGADFSGFTADSFQVKKISDIGALSSYSFVSAEGTPVWWNVNGIYTIASDNNGSNVISLSNDTIKNFFFDIPANSKKYCQGSYDKLSRIITWVYRSNAITNFVDNFNYDRMLHFNIDTKAFYPYSVANSTWKVSGVVNIFGDVIKVVQDNVTNNALEAVVDSASLVVTGTGIERYSIDSVTKFFVQNGTSSTWAEEKDQECLDWSSSGTGVNYSSYFVSGYKLRGESQKDFQSNYVTITSLVKEDSSFLLSGHWDYAINNLGNKITTKQEGYLHKPHQKYSSKKLKIRGTGKVLQYKVESRQGKPFNIVGWATYDTVSGNV